MAKLSAFGTALKKGATTIAQVRNVAGPGLDVDTLDVTTHDSPPPFREFIAGLIDAGEISFELLFDPAAATHGTLLTDMVARTVAEYSVTVPGGGANDVMTFDAFVSGFAFQAPTDGELVANVTLKASGDVAFS